MGRPTVWSCPAWRNIDVNDPICIRLIAKTVYENDSNIKQKKDNKDNKRKDTKEISFYTLITRTIL